MTLLEAEAEPEVGRTHRHTRLRRWLTAVTIVMALAGIGVGIDALVFVSTYQPLGPGNVTGDRIGHAKDLTDGVTDPSAIILTGPPRSTGGVMQSVENDGKHAVRILGAQPGSLVAVHYVPGVLDGSRSWASWLRSARPFPTTLQPGQQINVFMMATKPNSCKGAEGITTSMSVELRTESFDVHHTYDLTFNSGASNVVSLVVCPQKRQLRYVSRSFG
jgi:hypothetical protein